MKLNKLKGKLVECNMSYEDCAKELGISKTAFSNKMQGNSNFTVEEAKNLSDVLHLNTNEKEDIFLS